MNEISLKWLDDANILIKVPTVKITCPECNNGTLIVKDGEIPEWEQLDI